ncbi:hypothetical protein LXL04_031570 [Taraxacum kok-saghyz]
MAPEKSKILIIGGTGYIGQFVVEASAKAGHPTSVLVRESTAADPLKGKLIDKFKNSGVTLVFGDLYDHQSLVNEIKQADVVISTVGKMQIPDQTKIIAAIKEAGNIKRFLPSEFGIDVDHQNAIEPASSMFAEKVQIRRAIEAERIPFTYIACNCFSGYFLSTLAQPGAAAVPPRDKVTIHGDGTPKGTNEFMHHSLLEIFHLDFVFVAVFNEEHDIGTYTIKAVDDPRTLNKILYIKPPENICSLNELVSLWEKKIGKSLERSYVPEEQLLKLIQESPFPMNVALAVSHSIFLKGDVTNFEIEPRFGVEASETYPDVKYTCVDEYLDRFV